LAHPPADIAEKAGPIVSLVLGKFINAELSEPPALFFLHKSGLEQEDPPLVSLDPTPQCSKFQSGGNRFHDEDLIRKVLEAYHR
jgi:hypothetical protein